MRPDEPELPDEPEAVPEPDELPLDELPLDELPTEPLALCASDGVALVLGWADEPVAVAVPPPCV